MKREELYVWSSFKCSKMPSLLRMSVSGRKSGCFYEHTSRQHHNRCSSFPLFIFCAVCLLYNIWKWGQVVVAEFSWCITKTNLSTAIAPWYQKKKTNRKLSLQLEQGTVVDEWLWVILRKPTTCLNLHWRIQATRIISTICRCAMTGKWSVKA